MHEHKDHKHGLFEQRGNLLKFAAALWTLSAVFLHFTFPIEFIWYVAIGLSISMNTTYPIQALSSGRYITKESAIALALCGCSLLALWWSPLFVIAAIFGHGVWDLLKLRGAGIGIANWYSAGCFIVDIFYAVSLFLFWIDFF